MSLFSRGSFCAAFTSETSARNIRNNPEVFRPASAIPAFSHGDFLTIPSSTFLPYRVFDMAVQAGFAGFSFSRPVQALRLSGREISVSALDIGRMVKYKQNSRAVWDVKYPPLNGGGRNIATRHFAARLQYEIAVMVTEPSIGSDHDLGAGSLQ